MRRSDRERGREFALEVIDRCEYGVAAISTGEEIPYCIPLSLVRVGEQLYFHCALEGRKVELLRRNPKMCISFVGSNNAATDDFTTYFTCALVEGTAYEVIEQEEKVAALRALCEKLTPSNMADFDNAIARSISRTGVWGIRMERVTGKEKSRG